MYKRTSKVIFLAFSAIILAVALVSCGDDECEIIETSPVPMPFKVYTDKGTSDNHYIPSGWMGDTNGIRFDDGCTDKPYAGKTCIKITYTPGSKGWAGIYWQDPENNWGDKTGGFNLSKAQKLTFWARGDKGGEISEFKMGGIEGKCRDSVYPVVSTGEKTLNAEWKPYNIPLAGLDLSHVIGGFCWVSNDPSGCTVYLDEIRYE